MRWMVTMDDGWTWQVRARTEDEARRKVAKLERKHLGRARAPVTLERR